MKSFEASGRTVEEAINSGLAQQGLSIGDVSVEILEEGSKGLFGLFGSKEARVRLTLNEDEGPSATQELFRDSLSKKPAPRQEPQAKKSEAPAKAEAQPKADKPPREPRRDKPAREEAAPSKPKAPRKPQERKPRQEEARSPEQPRLTERVLTGVEAPEAGTPAGVAKEFLEKLTALMGLSITVSLAVDGEGNVFATLDGDPQGILIGRRGETLDALQYLTSLNINKGREEYIRVTIDSEGYRQKREEALVRLANRMANRARKTGRRVSMEPMNPYERRIFHSALQTTPGIATHSEGEEPNRHIVITPVKDEAAGEEG